MRAVLVSLSYSITSYAIACVAGVMSFSSMAHSPRVLPLRIAILLNWLIPPISVRSFWTAAGGAIFFGLLGSCPAFVRKSLYRVWLIVAVCSIFGSFCWAMRELVFAGLAPQSGIRGLVALSFAFCVAVACDFLLLSVDRRILRWSLSAHAVLGPLAIILANVILGFSVFVPQFVFDNRRGFWNWGIWEVMQIACSANMFTVFIAFLIILSVMVLISHRLVWPLVARPVYAVSQHAVIRNSKLLGALGATCLLWAFPGSALLHKLKELL